MPYPRTLKAFGQGVNFKHPSFPVKLCKPLYDPESSQMRDCIQNASEAHTEAYRGLYGDASNKERAVFPEQAYLFYEKNGPPSPPQALPEGEDDPHTPLEE